MAEVSGKDFSQSLVGSLLVVAAAGRQVDSAELCIPTSAGFRRHRSILCLGSSLETVLGSLKLKYVIRCDVKSVVSHANDG